MKTERNNFISSFFLFLGALWNESTLTLYHQSAFFQASENCSSFDLNFDAFSWKHVLFWDDADLSLVLIGMPMIDSAFIKFHETFYAFQRISEYFNSMQLSIPHYLFFKVPG